MNWISWRCFFQTDHLHRTLRSVQMHLPGMNALNHMALSADALPHLGTHPMRSSHQNELRVMRMLPNARQTNLFQGPIGRVRQKQRCLQNRSQVLLR